MAHRPSPWVKLRTPKQLIRRADEVPSTLDRFEKIQLRKETSMDPVETLRAVIRLAETAQSLTNLLDKVKRIDESSMATLERLIRERYAIVVLLKSHSKAKHDHAHFDFEYKENFHAVVGKYLTVKPHHGQTTH